VAQGAIGGEACRDMSWVRGSAEVCLVAPVASGGQGCVVVVDMALRASDGNVRASQRERRVVVIEGGPSPGGCGVASLAGGGETRRDVGRSSGCVEVCLVASVASGGQGCVVVVDMALRTSDGDVRAG